jgi:hypothetical protein
MTICSIKKEENLFHANFIFRVDQRDISLIHEKINECEKGFFLLNMKFCFLKWVFYSFLSEPM